LRITIFKYLFLTYILAVTISACEKFKPADEESWENGYSPEAAMDTTSKDDDYYIPYRKESYKITCFILDSVTNKTIYRKEFRVDSALVISDSIRVNKEHKYLIHLACSWEGANMSNTIELNADKLYYFVKLSEKENGQATFKDYIKPASSFLKIRFGILKATQEIDG
jgi:hypothetical protein